MSIEKSFDAETRETVSLEEGIKVYQRDRSNLELKKDLLDRIRARAVFLSREQFAKRAKDEGRDDPVPMSEFFGFGGGMSRPIINKEACPPEHQPYILTHECLEVLETGPWVDEREAWKNKHGADNHPQLAVNSHKEATHEEYRHAQTDGMLKQHHDFMVGWAEKLVSEYSGTVPGLVQLVERETVQRRHIFEEMLRMEGD